MIGILVGAVSFVDEGSEKVLDVVQERACVNALSLAVFTYGRGIAGRQIPSQPLPDHGKQAYDRNFHSWIFAIPHPQYYKNTVLKDTRAPDHGDLDILAEVLLGRNHSPRRAIRNVTSSLLVRLKSIHSGVSTGPPERVGEEVEAMHRAKQAWHWITSLGANMSQQTGPKIEVANLLPRQADGLIAPLAVLTGAVAFGLWRQSFAAALFAGVGLFLLAGIYNNTERMLAIFGRSEGGPRFGNVNARVLAESTTENTGALSQAIGSLKPWLANEVSLTEENAKECCAVLLDSVAGRASSANNNF